MQCAQICDVAELPEEMVDWCSTHLSWHRASPPLHTFRLLCIFCGDSVLQFFCHSLHSFQPFFFLLLACWRIMLDTFYSQLVASFLFTVHLLRSTALCIGIIWHVVYATPKWKRLWEKHHLRHSSKKKLTPLLVPHLPPLLLLVLYLDSCCSILFGPIHPIHFLLFTITWCVECYWRQVIY